MPARRGWQSQTVPSTPVDPCDWRQHSKHARVDLAGRTTFTRAWTTKYNLVTYLASGRGRVLSYIWPYPGPGGKSAFSVFYIDILYNTVHKLNLKQTPSVNPVSTRLAIISNWKEEARSLAAAIHENPDVPPASPRAIMTVEKAVWHCTLVGTVKTRGVPRSKAGGAARGTDENRCRLMFLWV